MVIDDIIIIKLTGVNFAVVDYVPSVDAVHLHLVWNNYATSNLYGYLSDRFRYVRIIK